MINDFNSSKAFEIDSIIADNTSATALTRSGNGTVILTDANTYTGSTFIHSGTLQISSDGNFWDRPPWPNLFCSMAGRFHLPRR